MIIYIYIYVIFIAIIMCIHIYIYIMYIYIYIISYHIRNHQWLCHTVLNLNSAAFLELQPGGDEETQDGDGNLESIIVGTMDFEDIRCFQGLSRIDFNQHYRKQSSLDWFWKFTGKHCSYCFFIPTYGAFPVENTWTSNSRTEEVLFAEFCWSSPTEQLKLLWSYRKICLLQKQFSALPFISLFMAEQGPCSTPKLGFTSCPILVFSLYQYSLFFKDFRAETISAFAWPVCCIHGKCISRIFPSFMNPCLQYSSKKLYRMFQMIFPVSDHHGSTTKVQCPARCPTSTPPPWRRCSH